MRNLRLMIPFVATFAWFVASCGSSGKHETSAQELALRAEAACKQVKGTFTPPNFCRAGNSEFFSKFGGVASLPDGWMCANPPHDQDPNYGGCLNPKTRSFDFNYCIVTGLPKGGCALALRPKAKE